MQEDINMYIIQNKLNDASYQWKHNPMFKNILWRQNNFENGKEFNISSDLEKLTETLQKGQIPED